MAPAGPGGIPGGTSAPRSTKFAEKFTFPICTFFLFTNASKWLRMNSRASLWVIPVFGLIGSIARSSRVRGLRAELSRKFRQKLIHRHRWPAQELLQQTVDASALPRNVVFLQLQ